MIRSKLKRLRLEKEEREGHSLPWAQIAEDTGLSYGTLTRLSSGTAQGVEFGTLATLCAYFGCGVGEVLEYVPGENPPNK